MTLEKIKYKNTAYFFDIENPRYYYFDEKNIVHVISYTLRDYEGTKVFALWKIPGTDAKDIKYAQRLVLLLTPNRLLT